MPISKNHRTYPRPTTRSAASVLLCLLLPGQMLPVRAYGSAKAVSPASSAAALTPDQRLLHVLDRFTFGPTSEDLASLRQLAAGHNQDKKGGDMSAKNIQSAIDRWFDQQLHPDSLPSSPQDLLLHSRLSDYPAMNLNPDQLLESFPSNAEIRQAAQGKRPMPSDPTLAAIYTRHIRLYEEKQEKKAQDPRSNPQSPQSMASQPSSAPSPDATLATAGHAASVIAPDDLANGKLPNSAKLPDPAHPNYATLEVKTVLALPPAERVHRLLTMPPAQYEQFRSTLKGPQKQLILDGLNPNQRELIADYHNPTRAVIEELESQRLLRDIYSSHQLQEVMTTFWLNHFNVFLHKNEETPYYLVSYERDVIRPRALGNFEDLLVATAESPAMMLYLDNATSTGPGSPAAEKQKQRIALNKNPNPKKTTPSGLNENYARELMELHTLGVNGGYTQKDVTEVARVFTGWTVEKPAQGGNFQFDENRHDPGSKLVLGHTIQEHGQQEGLQILHILATSPATAHFISKELAIAFVSDNPSRPLVNRMAQSFLKSHGDIPTVLRTMLHSPEFWSSSDYEAKVKTPLEYVISAVRATGATISNTQPLVQALNQMGMPLYGCVPPTGYAAKADAWVSTGALVTRMNFGLTLAANHYPGIKTEWSNSTNQGEDTLDLVERRLEAQLAPSGLSEKTRAAILDQAQNPSAAAQPASYSAVRQAHSFRGAARH